jgi:hypothetical protein
MATHLQRRAHIDGVKAGLLREIVSKGRFCRPDPPGGRDQSLAAHTDGAAPLGGGDQHGRRGDL